MFFWNSPAFLMIQCMLWRRKWQTHSSTLAWKIPWTEERGKLQSMESQRVGHDWVTSLTQEMGISDHLTCLLRNLYADQETTVRTGHGTADWFQIGKEACQGCILSPCLFYLHSEYIIWNARLEEAKAGIKISRRNINNLWWCHLPEICRWHHPYGRKWRRTKEHLDATERGEWKSWVKTQY